MDEQELKNLIRTVLRAAIDEEGAVAGGPTGGLAGPAADNSATAGCPAGLDVCGPPGLGLADPADKAGYLALQQATTARIGVGRAGPRLPVKAWLRFRADHAAAMDAVFTDVSADVIKSCGLFEVSSAAPDKASFLMDPALGRSLGDETAAALKKHCKAGAQVQIVVSDGLSSTAVENNIPDLLPALRQGLERHGLTCGTPIFVKFGRVRVMDEVTAALGGDVTVILIGERPGLVTNASLSCYMTYKGRPGMPESGRTVLSNIYDEGTPPAEAGAYIADIAAKMVSEKASGLDLKL
ncbi:MAG: ethanolamine ammonia-lyase subunit EutC [Propionibacteriaceae bacterium]|nr:ethanolamine ammonia-lyase subunit EutC [Propionibacteriaceae bacterium]